MLDRDHTYYHGTVFEDFCYANKMRPWQSFAKSFRDVDVERAEKDILGPDGSIVAHSPLAGAAGKFLDTLYQRVSEDIQPLLVAASDFMDNPDVFADFIEDLSVDLVEVPGSPRKALLQVLKQRVNALGYAIDRFPSVECDGNGASLFIREALSQAVPFIDLVAEGSDHGDLSHLLQWVFILDALEKDFPGRGKKFFDWLVNLHHTYFWNYLFDAGPAHESLRNPAFINRKLQAAFEGGFPGCLDHCSG